MMTEAQRQRYKRHILLPEIDVAGQKKMLESNHQIYLDTIKNKKISWR